jgi:hypothetical protein
MLLAITMSIQCEHISRRVNAPLLVESGFEFFPCCTSAVRGVAVKLADQFAWPSQMVL